MDDILDILNKDARRTPAEIAKMIGKSESYVKKEIKKYEKDGTIAAYKAVINKDLIEDGKSCVRALIEVRLMPQKNVGFDHIAERVYNFPEVTSCYLLSGTYDLLVIVEGSDMQTVAHFVAAKLSPLENVQGTTTHFILKKYKEDGQILKKAGESKRLSISY